MLLVKHETLTFDIENIKLTSVNFVNFHALTSDNNLTFDGYIQEVRELTLKCKVYWN